MLERRRLLGTFYIWYIPYKLAPFSHKCDFPPNNMLERRRLGLNLETDDIEEG
jgi:hypothetical protein